MGHDGALGVARRAAGVHLVEVVGRFDLAIGRRRGLPRVPFRVVVEALVVRGVDGDEFLDAFKLIADGIDGLDVFGADDEDLGAGVIDNVGQFGGRQAVIEGNGATPAFEAA
jgi:hypothetical protein